MQFHLSRFVLNRVSCFIDMSLRVNVLQDANHMIVACMGTKGYIFCTELTTGNEANSSFAAFILLILLGSFPTID